MTCNACGKGNDGNALFCENCGRPLATIAPAGPGKRMLPTVTLALLIAAVIVVAAAGYYKFILPGGVAASVNGEDITIAEVDGAVRTAAGGREVPQDMAGRMRSRVLSWLITERLAEQEALAAGVAIAPEEVEEAFERSLAASGLDRDGFEAAVAANTGSVKAFRAALVRQLLVRKHLTGHVAAGISDPAAADARVAQWLRDISSRAVVRVALKDDRAQAGCSCCNGSGPAGAKGSAPQGGARTEEARRAAIAWWQERHGRGPVEALVRDRGCHLEVDIIDGKRTAASLRYQNGKISDL